MGGGDGGRRNLIPVNIEDEMKQSYLDYAMSVIVGRALPDIRDGLKPVHRRILYGMHEMGLAPNRPTTKSAKITGQPRAVAGGGDHRRMQSRLHGHGL